MPPNAKPKIDWFLPYPIEGSGGHRTILAHVRDLVHRGYECVIHVQEQDPHDSKASSLSARELKRLLEGYFFPTGARVVASWERPEPCDIRMATAWESAYAVHRSPDAKRTGYFVQDLEAWFRAMGDGHIDAENSYLLRLECITIERFLTHHISTGYKGSADYFDFIVDGSLYFGSEEARTPSPSVAFLYQPEKSRRCPWLGRETLGIVKHRLPEAKVLLYGSPEDSNLWFEHENLRLITPPRCADLYRQTWVGLCISASNPSRIPYEMMPSGCAAVDIARENNAFDYEPGAISLAEPGPEALADAIVCLLQDGAVRARQVRTGLEMMATREDRRAFDRVEELLLRLHETSTVRDNHGMPRPRLPSLESADSKATARKGGAPQASARAAVTEMLARARQQVNRANRARDMGRRIDGRLRTALAERGTGPTASYEMLWKEMPPLLVPAAESSFWDLRAPTATSPSPTTPTSSAHALVNAERHSLSCVQPGKNLGRVVLVGRRVPAFGVFDTILVRPVAPEAIKERMAHEAKRLLRPYGIMLGWHNLLTLRENIERALCQETQRAGLDDEFEYETMLARWIEAAGDRDPAGRRAEVAAALRAHEEQVEIAAQKVHPGIPPVPLYKRWSGIRGFNVNLLALSIRERMSVFIASTVPAPFLWTDNPDDIESFVTRASDGAYESRRKRQTHCGDVKPLMERKPQACAQMMPCKPATTELAA